MGGERLWQIDCAVCSVCVFSIAMHRAEHRALGAWVFVYAVMQNQTQNTNATHHNSARLICPTLRWHLFSFRMRVKNMRTTTHTTHRARHRRYRTYCIRIDNQHTRTQQQQ